MTYQVVFVKDGLSLVDFETNDYLMAEGVKNELETQLCIIGEKDFKYIIKVKAY